MADVETTRDLLMMALQDLHDGECAMAERLATVRGHCADDDLHALLGRDETRSAQQRDAFAAMLRSFDEGTGDQPNIWLRAVLDDADNDADTIARGPLRDIALVGALRKGKQSQRVSYKTAIALARVLGLDETEAALTRMAEHAETTDTALAEVLARLSAGLQADGGIVQRGGQPGR